MNTTSEARAAEKPYAPFTDIYEMEDLYALKLEVPGVSKDNLEIEINDDELIISGRVSDESDNSTLRYSEYNRRNFYRAFKIGNDIDRSSIEASLEDGVLTLKLHKSEEVKPRKISINSAH